MPALPPDAELSDDQLEAAAGGWTCGLGPAPKPAPTSLDEPARVLPTEPIILTTPTAPAAVGGRALEI